MAIIARSGPAWWRQLLALPPRPVPAPVGGLACAELVIAPGAQARATRAPFAAGYVQRAPQGSGLTIRLVGLVDDATGAPVPDATVAVAVVDGTGTTVATPTLANLPGTTGDVSGDYGATLATLPAGRYTATATATTTNPARQLVTAAVFVVGPYYGG